MDFQSSPKSTYPPNAIHWAESALQQKVIEVEVMVGSTSAKVLSLRAEDDTEYVLRLFTLEDWLKKEPDLARHEAAVLERVAAAQMKTPRLIAFDEWGTETTHPAILMTKLSGRVNLKPTNFNHWLQQLAKTLHLIHQVPADNFQWHYNHWFEQDDLSVPNWTSNPDLFSRLIDYLQKPEPPQPSTFLHRDYHPTNVLWVNDHLSGVVDWVNGCAGPAMVDVAHCRLNLAGLYGVEAADLFLDHWISLVGAENYSAWWDIAGLANGWLFKSEQQLTVYTGWSDFGNDDVTVDLLRSRLENYAQSLLRKSSRKVAG